VASVFGAGSESERSWSGRILGPEPSLTSAFTSASSLVLNTAQLTWNKFATAHQDVDDFGPTRSGEGCGDANSKVLQYAPSISNLA
jgi:hypothetical protein